MGVAVSAPLARVLPPPLLAPWITFSCPVRPDCTPPPPLRSPHLCASVTSVVVPLICENSLSLSVEGRIARDFQNGFDA